MQQQQPQQQALAKYARALVTSATLQQSVLAVLNFELLLVVSSSGLLRAGHDLANVIIEQVEMHETTCSRHRVIYTYVPRRRLGWDSIGPLPRIHRERVLSSWQHGTDALAAVTSDKRQ